MKSSMDNFETAQAKTLALKSSLENVPFNLILMKKIWVILMKMN